MILQSFHHGSVIFVAIGIVMVISISESAYASEVYLPSTKWSFGNGYDSSSFFSSITISKTGNIYAVDRDGSRINEFTNNGMLVKNWNFQNPLSGTPPNQIIATDSSNNVYVADNNGYIQEYTGDGAFVTKWQPKIGLHSIALDSSGNVFIYGDSSYIYKFSNNGTLISKWSAYDNSCNTVGSVQGITVDSSDNILVAGQCSNQVIKKFSQHGNLITKWGLVGSGSDQFNDLNNNGVALGITTDSSGNVFVTDGYGGFGVKEFTTDGIFITQVNATNIPQEQINARGVAVDNLGYVYTIDQSNTIRKFVSAQTPIANNQTIPTSEDYPVNVTLTGITDKTQSPVFSIVSKPSHGMISGNLPSITYTPSKYYIGNDTFTFKITEGTKDSNIATITMTMEAGKYTPIVNAGPNQIANSGTLVRLDGSGSFDPDGEKITYSWLQTGGIPVTLSGNTMPKPSFTAPQVNSDTVLTFVLTVSDGISNNSTSTTMTVKPHTILSPTNQNNTNSTQSQVPIQQNQTNHLLQNDTNQQQITPPQTTSIPNWVKGNAKYWHDGTLGDDEFEQGIKYMIDNKIIKTDMKTKTNSGLKSIPKWVKSNAGWWADGTISQDDFLKGIEYLVEKGIINIK